jgi:hypothetical protein
MPKTCFIFRWAYKLVAFFISVLKGVFTIIAVLVVVIIPKLLMHPAVVPFTAFLSAVFWFWSAFVSVPKEFFVSGPIGGGSSSPNLTVLSKQLAYHFFQRSDIPPHSAMTSLCATAARSSGLASGLRTEAEPVVCLK